MEYGGTAGQASSGPRAPDSSTGRLPPYHGVLMARRLARDANVAIHLDCGTHPRILCPPQSMSTIHHQR